MAFTNQQGRAFFHEFSSIASCLADKPIPVRAAPAGELGYTTKENIIYLSLTNKIYDTMTPQQGFIFLRGIFSHELLHVLITDFTKYIPAIKRHKGFAQNLYHDLLNILEDGSIENFAPEYLSSDYTRSLEFVRAKLYQDADPISKDDAPAKQFFTAILMFRFFGFLKGKIYNKKARRIFAKCVPLFGRCFEEPCQEKRIEYADRIFELSRPLWEKQAKESDEAQKALEDMLNDLMKKYYSSKNNGSGNGTNASDPATGKDSTINKCRRITFRRISAEEYEHMMEDEGGGSSLPPNGPVREKPSDGKSGISVPVVNTTSEEGELDEKSGDAESSSESKPKVDASKKTSSDTSDEDGVKDDVTRSEDSKTKEAVNSVENSSDDETSDKTDSDAASAENNDAKEKNSTNAGSKSSESDDTSSESDDTGDDGKDSSHISSPESTSESAVQDSDSEKDSADGSRPKDDEPDGSENDTSGGSNGTAEENTDTNTGKSSSNAEETEHPASDDDGDLEENCHEDDISSESVDSAGDKAKKVSEEDGEADDAPGSEGTSLPFESDASKDKSSIDGNETTEENVDTDTGKSSNNPEETECPAPNEDSDKDSDEDEDSTVSGEDDDDKELESKGDEDSEQDDSCKTIVNQMLNGAENDIDHEAGDHWNTPDVTMTPEEYEGSLKAMDSEMKKLLILTDEEVDAIRQVNERYEASMELAERNVDGDETCLDLHVGGGFKDVCKKAKCQNIFVDFNASPASVQAYNRLVASMSGGIASLTSQLGRILRNRQEERMYKPSGKVSIKRLNSGRITSRVFTKRKLPDATEMAVVLGIDISGSMRGAKIAFAQKCAIALAEVFGNLGIPLYIFGFSADENGFDVNHFHYVNWSNKKLERLRLLGIKAHTNNFDGYSIRYATELLRRKDADKKLLLVVSDGNPAARAYFAIPGIQDVQLAVNEANRVATTIGILLGNLDPKYHRQMYGYNFIHCNRVEELFPQLARILKKYI